MLICSRTALGRLDRFPNVSQKTSATKLFVFFHTNTMLIEHFHNMSLIFITQTLMSYSQCRRFLCQMDICSVCSTHIRISKTQRSLTTLPDAAMVPSPPRIIIYFSIKLVVHPFGAAALTENRYTLASGTYENQYCVVPHAVVQNLDIYRTFTICLISTYFFQAQSCQEWRILCTR
jgi:hypothetical protein